MNPRYFLYICLCFVTLFANAQTRELREKANNARRNGDLQVANALYTTLISQLGENDPRLTEAYGNRAYCNKQLGNYTIALSDYDKAIENANSKYQAILKLNKSDLMILLGLYSDAEKIIESVISSDENIELHKIANLSVIYQCKGEFEKSIGYLSKVINKSNDRKTKSIALQNRAFAYMDYSKDSIFLAINDFRESLSLMEQESTDYYIILSNKAIAEVKSNSKNQAIEDINKSLAGLEKRLGTAHLDYQRALRKKAYILQASGDYYNSKIIYSSYIDNQKEYVKQTFYNMSEQNRLDFWKSIKPNISEIFALESYCPDFLLDVALFRREVAFLGNADKKKIDDRLAISGKKLQKSLKSTECAVDFIRYTKEDTIKYGAIIIPSLKMKKSILFLPLWKEKDLHEFKLENGHTLVDALCSNSLVDKDILYTDTLLSHFVWDKLNSVLENYDYEDIYFAPDGILHLFAIEYLRADNGVSLHRLTTLSNLINRKVHSISGKSKMLAAGGFDYDAVGQKQVEANAISNHDAMDYLQSKLKHVERPFTYLDGAKIEVDSITKISPFKVSSVNVKSEEQLKDDIIHKKYNILHLSTHGYALDVDVPFIPEALRDSITEDKSLLASGIALTSANVAYKNQSQEDGIISAREFCEMDMSHIDLMVLSACQTGLGRFNDEGPAGLVRGLKKAGAGALIVSLWNVSDEATMLFMKHLYKAMSEQSTIDIHAAFNTARLNLSTETKQVRRFNSKRMKTDRFEESYNQPRFCNSFVLIDAIK